MQIKQIYGRNHDGEDTLRIEVNGKERINAYPGEEVEDCSLERNLSFVYDIASLMREAWQAGKDGEDFSGEEEKEDEK